MLQNIVSNVIQPPPYTVCINLVTGGGGGLNWKQCRWTHPGVNSRMHWPLPSSMVVLYGTQNYLWHTLGEEGQLWDRCCVGLPLTSSGTAADTAFISSIGRPSAAAPVRAPTVALGADEAPSVAAVGASPVVTNGAATAVRAPICESVGALIWASVGALICASVRALLCASVGAGMCSSPEKLSVWRGAGELCWLKKGEKNLAL